MRFKLYRCEIKRASGLSTCHVIGANREYAASRIFDHDEALGLAHDFFSLKRIDQTLQEEQRLSLDDLLINAPAGLVSFTNIGWVAHAAPVHKLRLFASQDDRGVAIFAVAPNAGVALALMVNTQLPRAGQVYTFDIRDITDSLPEDERKNLDEVLTAGQSGIAECDDEHDGWWVW